MKPSVPKGTRDFSPAEMVRRNFIFKTIREVFERYGYQPIETPAMENLETLTGKYGDEGDKLIFKITPRGDKLMDVLEEIRNTWDKKENLPDLINKKMMTGGEALRYDLTVPFARYVVQHQNEITFPFKRYQIQPVWRADKPQKGRYREFYQCDADVIGSDSLLNEVELVQIINDVYFKLGISVTIKINNRKILSGLAEVIGEKEKIVDITVAIDKLDKIGPEGVNKELQDKGVSANAIKELQPVISFRGNYAEKIAVMKKMLAASEIGKKGIEEVEFIFASTANCQLPTAHFEFDITLARGLNYYTGSIIEVKSKDVQIGSICGGGRYDDLTGIFGLPNVSGVGISFGIDRIYDVMNELNLFEKLNLSASTTKVLLAHFGEEERTYGIKVASQLRSAGINTEIYPDIVKRISKQFDYANKKQIPYVIVIGSEEMKAGELTLKNMISGEQMKVQVEQIVQKLKS